MYIMFKLDLADLLTVAFPWKASFGHIYPDSFYILVGQLGATIEEFRNFLMLISMGYRDVILLFLRAPRRILSRGVHYL